MHHRPPIAAPTQITVSDWPTRVELTNQKPRASAPMAVIPSCASASAAETACTPYDASNRAAGLLCGRLKSTGHHAAQSVAQSCWRRNLAHHAEPVHEPLVPSLAAQARVAAGAEHVHVAVAAVQQRQVEPGSVKVENEQLLLRTAAELRPASINGAHATSRSLTESNQATEWCDG